MAHTLANDKNMSAREADEVDVVIIDPEQEEEIQQLRQKLNTALQKDALDSSARSGLKNPRKRSRSCLEASPDACAPRRVRPFFLSRLDKLKTSIDVRPRRRQSPLDVLTDDLLIEIFTHLPQLPHLLRIRQVCKRWYDLSCHPRLWTSLSFKGHEHVTSGNLQTLCKSTPSLCKLKKISLAQTHGVSDVAVRHIPRTACAATLESVDLTWCSGATDRSVVEFSRCPGLRELRLSHCRDVTRRSIGILAVRCPRLELLEMNCISGIRDKLLGIIGQNCPYLRVLNIANARSVTDEGIANVASGCLLLEVLDLSWCLRVTDSGVSKIASNLRHLRDVGLSETRVTDVGITELTRWCTKLEAIHLARCINISNDGVKSIIKHCGTRLMSLNLASCQNVNDYYVERLIEECPSLACLDVSKLPCRNIADMLKRLTATRNLQVYY